MLKRVAMDCADVAGRRLRGFFRLVPREVMMIDEQVPDWDLDGDRRICYCGYKQVRTQDRSRDWIAQFQSFNVPIDC